MCTGPCCLTENDRRPACTDLLSFVLHIDKHLNSLILQHGKTTYLILWLIVFCETGLVLTPFLPGDSLLFTAGTFAARGSLDLGLLLVTFLTSAILGDAVNYAVGKWLGEPGMAASLMFKMFILNALLLRDPSMCC